MTELEGQMQLTDEIEFPPPAVAMKSRNTKAAPTVGSWTETKVQQKCMQCLRDMAADPTAPASKTARLIHTTKAGPDFLCVPHAVVFGYEGELTKKTGTAKRVTTKRRAS